MRDGHVQLSLPLVGMSAACCLAAVLASGPGALADAGVGHAAPAPAAELGVDLQLLVREEGSKTPIAGADVHLVQTGDTTMTDHDGVARFTRPDGYYRKGTEFEVVIQHPGYPMYDCVYLTSAECRCTGGLAPSMDHYDVRLAKDTGISAGANLPLLESEDPCSWEVQPGGQHELECTSHMDDADVSNDAPALGCVTYVGGVSPGENHIRTTVSERRTLEGSVRGSTAGLLRKLGFQITVEAGGSFTAEKDMLVEQTICGTTLPSSCNGEICLRPKMMSVTEDHHCWLWSVNGKTGKVEWQDVITGQRTTYFATGTCIDTSGLSCGG